MMKRIRASAPLSSDDWTSLVIGERVVLERKSRFPSTGFIDDINEDATIFWIYLDQRFERILIHDGDGSVIRRVLHT
ncbi:hypothetical protein AU252_00970 [Pseudarthrobacter sulfonivorans]|uniref:Uncharacterized protein n=1 Tax=Pseudarthrobacter sulfonivorans TaxID=121292 RepID=A0A0U3QHY3_9MICC|nr:hypothetical protein AU252_00970 [Pseudarthrobacter sulfonivorans]